VYRDGENPANTRVTKDKPATTPGMRTRTSQFIHANAKNLTEAGVDVCGGVCDRSDVYTDHIAAALYLKVLIPEQVRVDGDVGV
jgi:hypothetical protein